MATYKCLADLQGETLCLNDIVIFGNIEYKVLKKFLIECDNSDNDRIFCILSIPSKENFAQKAYGYEPSVGAWPECKPCDYEALTRLVIELYKIFEGKTSVIPKEEQWYKITTPGSNGISSEEVKALIIKYGGLINPDFNYKTELGVYVWAKNKKVDVFSKNDVREDAIEVSLTTKITTIKQEEKHENQFQRKKARIERGTRPEGSTVRGRRSKTSVAVGHLGYRKVTGI